MSHLEKMVPLYLGYTVQASAITVWTMTSLSARAFDEIHI